MSDNDRAPADRDTRLTRRRVLGALGRGSFAAGFARVFYEYTGFGHLTGTNLVEQPLEELASRNLEPRPVTVRRDGRRLRFDGDTVTVTDADGSNRRVPIEGTASRSNGHSTPSERFARALHDLEAGEYGFEFSDPETFFDRIRAGDPRPLAVAALRGEGFRPPDEPVLEDFTGVDPAKTASLVQGLATGFGDHTAFDAPRYVAEVVEKFSPVEGITEAAADQTDFEALSRGRTGLYCYEYAVRTVEAFHAIPTYRQSVPIFGGLVVDLRHNHAYAALGSVLQSTEGLTVPMTFLDYFYPVLFEILGLEERADDVGAYDRYHRATSLHYDNVYAWTRS